MDDRPKIRTSFKPLYQYTALAMVVWTSLIVLSLAWDYNTEHTANIQMARKEAFTSFNKDLAFRLWATRHGGVYVPVTPQTPANPYLSHVNDRDIITANGKKLTLMNPTYMLRQMMVEYAKLYDIKGHITSLKLLNPDNLADPWEKKALLELEKGAEEVVEVALLNGQPYLRMMRPMVTTAGCLKCHAFQDYRVGDVRGGVGVSVPLAPYLDHERQAFRNHLLFHFLFWALGLLAIGFVSRRIKVQRLERQRYEESLLTLNKELDDRVQERTAELGKMLLFSQTLIRVSDQQSLYHDITSLAKNALAFDFSTLMLLSKDSSRLIIKDTIGFPESTIGTFTLAQGQGLSTFVVHEKKAASVADFQNEQRFDVPPLVLEKNISSALCVPIMIDSEVFGVLIGHTLESREFTDSEVSLYQSLANQSAVALENHRHLASVKQAERRERENERFISTVFDTIQDGITVLDLDLNIVKTNNAMHAIYPHVLSMEGKKCYEVFHGVSKPCTDCPTIRALKSKKLEREELPFIDENGVQKGVLDFFAYPMLTEEGEVSGIVCYLRDITERKLAMDALQVSEERYRELIESTGDLVTSVDAEGKFIFVNHMAEKIFGLPPEALIGRPAFQLVHPDDQQATTAWLEECISTKVNQATFDNRQVHQSTGEAHHLLWSSNFHFDDNGEVVGVYGIGHDITERKEAEEKLKELSEHLSLLLESLPVVVYTRKCQGDLGITFVSSRIEEITGFPQARFTEEPTFWADHLHPEDRNKVMHELPTVLDQGRYHVCYRFRVADGSYRWFSCSQRLITLPDGSNSHIVGTWQDISEEKMRQLESDQRLQQIIQADKLSSLGEVVAGVAHEINNPNSFITYNVPLLAEIWQVLEPLIDRQTSSLQESRLSIDEYCEDMAEIISAIQTGSERINKVVNNLKDFARLDENAHSEAVQVNEVVDKAYSIVGAQVRKSTANIAINLEQDLPLIQGHFQKLEQVVANLLINAGHAINDKRQGKISISSHYNERLQAIVVSIEDNGLGMVPGTTARIFEPFFTTKRNSGGTGLGLSVSYGLIQEHNGLIGVLSRPEIGTRFTLILPKDPGHSQLDLQPTILLVDEEENLPVLEAELRSSRERHLVTLSSQKDVLPFLEEHPEVDIVLSPTKSTHIDGWQLLEQVKTQFPLITVVLLAEGLAEGNNNPTAHEPDCLLQKTMLTTERADCLKSLTRIRI